MAQPDPAPTAPSCVGALVLPRPFQGHLYSPRQPSSHLAIPLAPFSLTPLPRHPPCSSCPYPASQAGPGQGSPPPRSPFHLRRCKSTFWPFHTPLCPRPCHHGHLPPSPPEEGSAPPSAGPTVPHSVPEPTASPERAAPWSPGTPQPIAPHRCTPHLGRSPGTTGERALGKSLPSRLDFPGTPPSPAARAAGAWLHGEDRSAALLPGTNPAGTASPRGCTCCPRDPSPPAPAGPGCPPRATQSTGNSQGFWRVRRAPS